MRTTDKELRNRLRFDSENSVHWSGGFDIHWDSNVWTLRVSHALTVGAGGAVHLVTNYPRDPDARAALYRDAGIELCRVEDLPAMKTPDGRKIPKNALLDDIFLRQNSRVYNVTRGEVNGPLRSYATWYTLDSAPSVAAPMHVRERNKAREKQWLEDNAALFLNADAAFALADPDERGAAIRRWRVNSTFDFVRAKSLPQNRVDEFYIALGYYRKNGGKDWNEFFLNCTGDFREFPYLTVA